MLYEVTFTFIAFCCSPRRWKHYLYFFTEKQDLLMATRLCNLNFKVFVIKQRARVGVSILWDKSSRAWHNDTFFSDNQPGFLFLFSELGFNG